MNTPLLTSLLLSGAGILATAQETKIQNGTQTQAHQTLADFSSDETSLKWKTVNDGVMGGISDGSSSITAEQHLVFQGNISLENNGGFSSIRTYGKKHDLSAYAGLQLKIKGDGRMYYLTARTHRRQMLAFWSPIQTKKDEWITVQVPFSSFYATSFGRKIPGLRLNPAQISSIGFMIYDKQSGPFKIEVDEITTCTHSMMAD